MPFLSVTRCCLRMNDRFAPAAVVATKLRCLLLCKVKMSLGGFWGSLGRRCGDLNIAAAAAQAGGSGS